MLAVVGDEVVSLDGSRAAPRSAASDLPGAVADRRRRARATGRCIADPFAVIDREAAAATLAEILGGEAADVSQAQLDAGSGARRRRRGARPERRARRLDEAIGDGGWPGSTSEPCRRVAVANAAAWRSSLRRTGEIVSTVEVGPSTGSTYVTGLERPMLYVATGPDVTWFDVVPADGTSRGPAWRVT